MKSTVWSITFFLTFSSSTLTFGKCDLKNPVQYITLDSMTIDNYFRKDLLFRGDDIAFLTPVSFCFANSGRLEIRDGSGKVAGYFELSLGTDYQLTTKEIDQRISQEPRIQSFFDRVKALNLPPLIVLNTYFLLNFGQTLEDLSLKFRVYKLNQVTKEPNYWNPWNIYGNALTWQKDVTVIDYDGLTQLLKEHRPQLIDARLTTDHPILNSKRVFPSGKPFRGHLGIQNAMTLVTLMDFSKLDRNEPIVVFSDGFHNNLTYRVLLALRLSKFEKLYSLKDGYFGLLNYSVKPQIDKKFLLDNQTLSLNLKDSLILDVRSKEDYLGVRIPGAISIPSDEIPSLSQLQKDDRKFLPSSLQAILPLMKSKKRFVIIGLNEVDEAPYALFEIFMRNSIPNVMVASEGFAEWNAKSLWNQNSYIVDRKRIRKERVSVPKKNK